MALIGRGRAKRLVLDIGSSAVRLCELTQTKSGFQVSRYFQRELGIEPSLDEEEKKNRRREGLKALLKEAKVRTRKTIIGVPGRSVFTRTRTLPPVSDFKVTQIVRYEIQQQIPFGLDQIALDYQVLNRTEAGGYDVMMAAIKVDVIEKELDVLRDTKCVIDTVDVCPIAAYNWLKQQGELGKEGECVAMLDIGSSTTDIVIERNGQFHFTRPLNLGGDSITLALASAFGWTFADAEKFKRQRGFAPTGDPQRDGKVGEVIGEALNRLVTEVSRSFGYFRSLPGGGQVERVVIIGGGACLRNIVPYLQRQLGVEARIAHPLAGLAVGPAAQQANEHPEQAAAALGMALRTCAKAPIEINLIPPRVLEAARRREQVFYWVLSFITFALIAASVVPDRANKDRQVREQIETIKQYIRQYDPAAAESSAYQPPSIGELQRAKQDVKARIDEIKTLNNAWRGRGWLFYLQKLNELRPEGNKVWFASFETAVITPPGAGGEGGGRLGGPQSPGPGFGPNAAGPGRVNVKGFPGLQPSTQMSEGSRDRQGGPPRLGGGQQGQQQQAQAQAPDAPNGLRIQGYAKDAEALIEFINRLKGDESFKQGVHFDEATVREVPITEMDMAPLKFEATVRASGGAGGAIDGGAFRRRGGFGDAYTPQTSTPGPATGQYAPGQSVLSFVVTVQFGPFPAAPAPAQRPAAAMLGGPPPGGAAVSPAAGTGGGAESGNALRGLRGASARGAEEE